MSDSVTRTVFYVVHHEGRWRFEVNDEEDGPFCTQTAAIRAAVDAAHSAARGVALLRFSCSAPTRSFGPNGPMGTIRIQRR